MHFRGTHTTIHVSDAAGDEPLVGATVLLTSRRDTVVGTTMLESYGQYQDAVFKYDKTFRDSVEMKVSFLGYKPFIKRYSSSELAGWIRVQLLDDVSQISQIVIVGQRVAMVIKGDTTIYNAGSFKTLDGERFNELLRQLPGVELKNNKIYAQGEEVKRVYVDGRNFFGQNTDYALTDLKAEDVKSVKIYDQQSVDAKYMDDEIAPNEKVLDVVTHRKPKVIQGGAASALLGSSLDKEAFPGSSFRYNLTGNYFRNNEKGNQRVEMQFLENTPERDVNISGGIQPVSRQRVKLSNTLRRGDSLNFYTDFSFERTKGLSRSQSDLEYFPTESYTARNQHSTSRTDKSEYGFCMNNSFNRRRQGNVLNLWLNGMINRSENTGQNFTLQQIDDEQTMTDRHNNGHMRGGMMQFSASRKTKFNKWLSLHVGGDMTYTKSTDNVLNVDTLASNPLLRTILDNDAGSDLIAANATASIQFKLSTHLLLGLNYRFSYDYNKSHRASIDFIDDPSGNLDSVNSYRYTINAYRHYVGSALSVGNKKVNLELALALDNYRPKSDEQLPKIARNNRNYFNVLPWLYFNYRPGKHIVRVTMTTSPGQLSLEQLRSGLDVNDPLYVRAGNPDLHPSTDYFLSFSYNFNDAPHSSNYTFTLTGNFRVNYLANKSTLFQEATYLPQFDYTIQSGAQLIETVNANGYRNYSVKTGYSKRFKFGMSLFCGLNYNFSKTPYFFNSELAYIHRNSGTFRLSAISSFSTKFKISLSSDASLSYYDVHQQHTKDFSENLGSEITATIRKKYTLAVSTSYLLYRNYRVSSADRDDVMASASFGRKFGKKNNLELVVGVVDIFNRVNNARTAFTDNYISTSSSLSLGRYAYIQASCKFN